MNSASTGLSISAFLLFVWFSALGQGTATHSDGSVTTQSAVRTPKPSICIQISAPNSTVKADSDVMVNIALTNVSNKAISVYGNNGEHSAELGGYDVTVSDARGAAPSLTKWGRTVIKGEGTVVGSGGYSALEPGESRKNSLFVNSLYDLSQPGEYTVQLRRLDEQTSTMVTSNKLTFHVVP
jgi:hypothetical protein